MQYETTGESIRRTRAADGHIVRDAVIVPMMRAAVTGGAFGLLVGVLARLWRYPIDDCIMFGVAAALAVFLVSWCWPRSTNVKEPQGLQQLQVSADPERNSGHVVLLRPKTEDDHEAESDRLRLFVRRAAIDSGSRALRSAGFTDREVARYRDMLMRSGWSEWRGHKSQGWALTADPEDILEALK